VNGEPSRKCIISAQTSDNRNFGVFSQPNFSVMIQRLQTIYFIAIVIICIVACTGSLVNYVEQTPGMVKIYSLNFIYLKYWENGNLMKSTIQFELIALVSLVIGWTINIILGYKNRKRQMTHAKLNFLFIALLIFVLFVKAFTIPNFAFTTLSMQSTFGLALLFFTLYLNLRALMLIRKDEELVKSADRIR
jgi:hypothetical protein